MSSLFRNEDSIYFRDPPSSWPVMRKGLLRLTTVNPALFLSLRSFSFLNQMSVSLLFRKRQERPKARKSSWLDEMIGAFTVETVSLKPAQKYVPRSAEANVFGKEALHTVSVYREPFLLGPPCSQLKLHSLICKPSTLSSCCWILLESGRRNQAFLWSGDNQESFLMMGVIVW